MCEDQSFYQYFPIRQSCMYRQPMYDYDKWLMYLPHSSLGIIQFVTPSWCFHINGVNKLNVVYIHVLVIKAKYLNLKKSILGTLISFFFSKIKGLNVLKLQLTINLYWFLQGFEGIEYLVIPVDNATLTEFTEQHESSVWEDIIGRSFMELTDLWLIYPTKHTIWNLEKKKKFNDTMYSCNWLYLFINWFCLYENKRFFEKKFPLINTKT